MNWSVFATLCWMEFIGWLSFKMATTRAKGGDDAA